MFRGPTKSECERILQDFIDQISAENPNLLIAFEKFKEFISLIQSENGVTAISALRSVIANLLAVEGGNLIIHAIPGFLSKHGDKYAIPSQDMLQFLDLITEAMPGSLHRSHSQTSQRRHSNLGILTPARERGKPLSSSTPILSSSGYSSSREKTDDQSDIRSQSDPTLGSKDKKKRPFIRMIFDKLSPRSSKRISITGTKSTSSERKEAQPFQDEKDSKSQSSETVTEKHSSESTLDLTWLSWSWNEGDHKDNSSQTSYTLISETLSKSGGTKASTPADSPQDLLGSDNAASEDSTETKKSTKPASSVKSTSSISSMNGFSSSDKSKDKTSKSSGSEAGIKKSSKAKLH